MSREIHIIGPSGRSAYGRIINYNGDLWNGITFETYSAANVGDYDIVTTEDGNSGIYIADFPSTIDFGSYDVVLYIMSGASPADTDQAVGSQAINWRGANADGGDEVVGDITYLDIKTQVQYNLGRVGDTEVLAQLGMWAKMAMREIMTWRDHWFEHAEATVAIVDGTQTYDLPTDHKGNLKIFIQKTSSWVELDGPIDLVDARRRFAPDSEGEPTDWSYFEEDQFKVWPPDPGASFTLKLDYVRFIADLANDDDTNTLTVWYPSLLIAKMTELGFRYLQEFGDAREWKSEVDRLLSDIHANYVARTLGRDFHLMAKADVYANNKQSRGFTNYIVLR